MNRKNSNGTKKKKKALESNETLENIGAMALRAVVAARSLTDELSVNGLVYGSRSPKVATLHLALKEVGFPIDATESEEGVFGDSTCKALAEFKNKHRIENFPFLVNEETAKLINEKLRMVNAGFAVESPLYYGMRSSAVATLHKAIEKLKLGIVDTAEGGYFGKATGAVIVKFQKSSRINVKPCYVDEATALKLAVVTRPTDPSPDEKKPSTVLTITGRTITAERSIVARAALVLAKADFSGAGQYKKITKVSEIIEDKGLYRLKHTQSDGDGAFTFSLQINKDAQPDALIIFAASGKSVTGRSALITRDVIASKTIAGCDVIVPDRNSRHETEFSALMRSVEPVMDFKHLSGISPDQVRFLSKTLRQNPAHLRALAEAAALSDDKENLELFYCLKRVGISLQLANLVRVRTLAIQAAITQGSEENIIGPIDGGTIDKFLQKFKDMCQKMLLKNGNGQSYLKKVLNLALGDDTLQEVFYDIYFSKDVKPSEFWARIGSNEKLKEKSNSLLQINQLAALTGNNFPLMEKLYARTIKRGVTALLDLTSEQWMQLIGESTPGFIAGDTSEKRKENYAGYLSTVLNASFPNEKVAAMIKNGGIAVGDAARNHLVKFLTETKFDLRKSRLHDQVVKDKPGTFLDRIAEGARNEVVPELNKIQRVFQFSPSPEVMSRLIKEGIGSATMVASMPLATFMQKYGDVGDNEALSYVHTRATHIVSMIEYSILSLRRFSDHAGIPAITGNFNTKR